MSVLKCIQIITLLFGMVLSVSRTIPFTNCGTYHIDNLEIEGCTDFATCELLIGEDVAISFDVLAVHSSESFISEMSLIIRGQKFSIAADPNNPCVILTCPMTANYNMKYVATMHVNDTFVPIQAQLLWILNDDSFNPAVCINVDVLLVYHKSESEESKVVEEE